MQSMKGDSAVVIAGARVPCAVPVVLWGDSGLLFKSATARRKQTRVIFIHWTGSENAPKDVHRNMTARKTSVHFILPPDGVIYQTADADRQCAHVKTANAFSVGIEVVCRGDDREVPHKGVVRSEVTENVHGRPVRYACFTGAQSLSLLVLCTLLCDTYHLPVQVPIDRRGELITSVLSTVEQARFRGIAGHYHYFAGKADPGPKNLRIFTRGGGDAIA